ncbi:molybdopterin dinucleotide binding domain-containing protein [Tepidibacillus sp. HK-1]|uniref:molybdopterin dinucleotide binding domain-containing protein n=1 Tax=Tepidibacillus sp. HK-1 TaxID=1883407 RepID=UPI00085312C2|nr:molybdopterin dinucleotide binding domain-containing protein [Tepidibacillus sp. HK-1]GBF11259.1 tetrathionate reductase subunit A precursor [Tepidibacillus sp. HK-1]
MKLNRRNFLKASALIGSLSVFGIGLSKVTADETFRPMSNRVKSSTKTGQVPEAKVDLKTGKIELNPDIVMRNSVCLGCFSDCGNRLKIDKKTGQIIKVFGNPYHPSAAQNPIKYDTPLLEAYLSASRYEEKGITNRATVCPRGNSAFEATYDPQRILVPLKRNGKRGEGKWKPISYEELLNETVNGGKLFSEIGEDQEIEGLKQVRDFKTLIDPKRPELGAKVNQLVVLGGRYDGRTDFAKRFQQAYGTVNMYGHTGICGGARRIAYQAFLDEWKKSPHMKPDFDESDFIIFFGTAPGQAGNPYQPIIKKTNKAATEGRLQFAVVDPVLPNLTGTQAKWIPIKPGYDAALAMGMIRWIFENNRYNEKYLSAVNKETAASIGFPSWTNAAYLIIDDPAHPNYRKFLRANEIGLGTEEEYVVIDRDTLQPSTDKKSKWGQILFKGEIQGQNGNPIKVKTSLMALKENAEKYTLQQYSEKSGVPVEKIIWLADEFTKRGTRVGIDHHGGPSMHPNGFHNSLSIILLNALVGSVNKKGGMSKSAGGYKTFDESPKYNLLGFPEKPKPKGVRIAKDKFAYEKTTEYKEKVARGENPYPAKEPYYPFAQAMMQDIIPATIKGYPYKAKILINHQMNPFYTTPGLYQKDFIEGIKDPKNLPLIISIDVIMGETTAFADYIVPDTVFYESWGLPSIWNGMVNKVSATRWPVVTPKTPKLPDGRHLNMETYLIDVAKMIGMPGFGDQAIPGADGKLYPLHRQEDFYLRAIANIAYDETPVPDVDPSEVQLTGIDEMLKGSEQSLTTEEWKKALYVMVRGGRFEPHEKAYQGNDLKYKYPKILNIYNESVGSTRDSITGEYFEGTGTFIEPAFSDGTPIQKEYPESEWPFTLFSYKSRFRSTSTLANISKLRDVKEANQIQIARSDAERLGIHDGDQVKIVTPTGEATGEAKIRDGLMPGSIAIAFGYGHWEYGSKTYEVGGKEVKGNKKIAAGIALNPIAHREKNGNLVNDPVSGAISRNDTRAKIVKL